MTRASEPSGLLRSAATQTAGQFRVGISLLSQDVGQFTGTATYVRELIGEFRRRPQMVNVEVLCNEHTADGLGRLTDGHVLIRRASHFRVGDSQFTRIAALTAASAVPRRLARQFSRDLRLVHYPLTLMVPTVPLPTVVTVHDLLHRDMPQYFSRSQLLWRRHFYESAAHRATIVITDSEHARGRIIESLGIAPDRVAVIYLGVDHARFRPEPDAREDELVAALNLPARFIFYPASFWHHKNHLALLDAVERIGDDSLHLLLTGAHFGRRDEVMARAAANGLAGRVRYLGFVPDLALPVVYRRATVLAFPSSYEGFGAPPLEAMACGCPVASSRSASLPEVCGDAAAVLDPDDREQMASTLRAVVGDPELRLRLRRLGLERARRFSWDVAADAHLATYRGALELAG